MRPWDAPLAPPAHNGGELGKRTSDLASATEGIDD